MIEKFMVEKPGVEMSSPKWVVGKYSCKDVSSPDFSDFSTQKFMNEKFGVKKS
jgi:hypothetical protein